MYINHDQKNYLLKQINFLPNEIIPQTHTTKKKKLIKKKDLINNILLYNLHSLKTQKNISQKEKSTHLIRNFNLSYQRTTHRSCFY